MNKKKTFTTTPSKLLCRRLLQQTNKDVTSGMSEVRVLRSVALQDTRMRASLAKAVKNVGQSFYWKKIPLYQIHSELHTRISPPQASNTAAIPQRQNWQRFLVYDTRSWPILLALICKRISADTHSLCWYNDIIMMSIFCKCLWKRIWQTPQPQGKLSRIL